MSSVYGIQAVSLNGTQRAGVIGRSSNRQRKIRKDANSGAVHTTLRSPIRTAPKAEITTVELLTWIPVLNDSTDILCKALDGSNGLKMYAGAHDPTKPGYLASSAHRLKTGLRGLLCVDQISYVAGQAAEMTMSAYFKCTDGTTDPITDVTNAALPALPVPTEALILTSLTRGGSAVTAISSLLIKIDHKCTNDKDPECYQAGLPHPVDIITAGVNDAIDISMELETTDLSQGESAGETWVATFTKLGQGGALGTTGVIITASNVYAHHDEEGGKEGSGDTIKIMGETRFDGTNKPLSWSTF
jgi:hypothetical protein